MTTVKKKKTIVVQQNEAKDRLQHTYTQTMAVNIFSFGPLQPPLQGVSFRPSVHESLSMARLGDFSNLTHEVLVIERGQVK